MVLRDKQVQQAESRAGGEVVCTTSESRQCTLWPPEERAVRANYATPDPPQQDAARGRPAHHDADTPLPRPAGRAPPLSLLRLLPDDWRDLPHTQQIHPEGFCVQAQLLRQDFCSRAVSSRAWVCAGGHKWEWELVEWVLVEGLTKMCRRHAHGR